MSEGFRGKVTLTPVLPALEVCSKMRASHNLLVRPEQFDCVISIGDCRDLPPAGFVKFPGRKLRMLFDDVERPHPLHHYRPITWRQAQKLARFLRTIPVSERVMVHCAAGVSRSAAAALSLLSLHMNPISALKWLVLTFEVHPNRRVVWMMDELLKQSGAMIAAYRSYWGGEQEPHFVDWEPTNAA